MTARRGLNKGRGLGSLIPQKLQNEAVEEEKKAEKKQTEEQQARKKREKAQNRADTQNRTEMPSRTAETAAAEKQSPVGKKTSAKPAGKKAAGESPVEVQEGGTVTLRISRIVPNREQPRREFDENAIGELAESIRQYGVIQPILVQKKGNYYEIVAGERRWRAAKKAGLKEVPAIVRDFSEQETMEISLIENLQREDLNPIEEAEAYKKLLDTFALSQEEVAEKVGKSRTAVTNSLRLLRLSEPVRHLLVKGDLSMGHARALLALEDPEAQISAAHQVVSGRLSVRETEKLVKQILHPRKKPQKQMPDEQTALAYKAIEDQMQKKMGTKVAIRAHGNKGKIEIDYYSQEDLERIIDLIG